LTIFQYSSTNFLLNTHMKARAMLQMEPQIMRPQLWYIREILMHPA